MAHRVTAQLIVAKTTDARHEVYLSRGSYLPAEVDKDEVKRLTALGLIAEEKEPRAARVAAAAKAKAESDAAEAEAAAKAKAESDTAAKAAKK